MRSGLRIGRMLLCLLIGGTFFWSSVGLSQEKSSSGLITLLANPDRFDGKQITVAMTLSLDSSIYPPHRYNVHIY